MRKEEGPFVRHAELLVHEDGSYEIGAVEHAQSGKIPRLDAVRRGATSLHDLSADANTSGRPQKTRLSSPLSLVFCAISVKTGPWASDVTQDGVAGLPCTLVLSDERANPYRARPDLLNQVFKPEVQRLADKFAVATECAYPNLRANTIIFRKGSDLPGGLAFAGTVLESAPSTVFLKQLGVVPGLSILDRMRIGYVFSLFSVCAYMSYDIPRYRIDCKKVLSMYSTAVRSSL